MINDVILFSKHLEGPAPTNLMNGEHASSMLFQKYGKNEKMWQNELGGGNCLEGDETWRKCVSGRNSKIWAWLSDFWPASKIVAKIFEIELGGGNC